MQVNDTVIYTENGSQHVATVLEVRELEHHSGENGEPLLHLGFFAPVFKPGPNGVPTRVSLVGTQHQNDLVQFRLDVAHESHVFDEKLKRATYPGGRWRLISEIQTEDDDVLDNSLVVVEPDLPQVGDQSSELESVDIPEDPEDPQAEETSGEEIPTSGKKKKKSSVN